MFFKKHLIPDSKATQEEVCTKINHRLQKHALPDHTNLVSRQHIHLLLIHTEHASGMNLACSNHAGFS